MTRTTMFCYHLTALACFVLALGLSIFLTFIKVPLSGEYNAWTAEWASLVALWHLYPATTTAAGIFWLVGFVMYLFVWE